MTRVISTVESTQDAHYLRVVSRDETDCVLYDHKVRVDADPNLHTLLMDHPWFLNAKTGHLACQSARGAIRAAFEEQGAIPPQFSLGKAVAALKTMGSGRKIRRAYASTTDARASEVQVTYEDDRPRDTAVVLSAEPITAELLLPALPVHTSTISAAEQRRALADARRAEAERYRDACRDVAMKAKIRKAQEREQKEQAKLRAMAGEDLATVCRAMADDMLRNAELNLEAWAENARRAVNGHSPALHEGGNLKSIAQPPPEYVRLRRGEPLLIPEPEAAAEDPRRYADSQRAFAEYCSHFSQRLSKRGLRAAWLKRFPEHDWVAWVDDMTIPGPGETDPPVAVIGAPIRTGVTFTAPLEPIPGLLGAPDAQPFLIAPNQETP